MGMSVRRLLAEIDSRELTEWIEFAKLESIESPTRLTGELCSMLAAIGGQRIDSHTFLGLPPAEPDEDQLKAEDARNQTLFEGLAEAWFVQQGREDEFRKWEARQRAKRDGNDGRIP